MKKPTNSKRENASNGFEEHLRIGADLLQLETIRLAIDLRRRGELLDALSDQHKYMEIYNEFFTFRKPPTDEH